MSPFAHLKVIELEVTRCTRITGGRGDTENNYLHSQGPQFKGYIELIVTKWKIKARGNDITLKKENSFSWNGSS